MRTEIRAGGWLLLPLLLCCSTAERTSLQAIARIAAAAPVVGPERRLSALDASGDGRLDAADHVAFDAVAAAAEAALAARGRRRPLREDVYEGPPKDAPSVFSFVRVDGGRIDLTAVPDERLAELAIEARWAAAQARLAALAPGAADGKAIGGLFASALPGYDSTRMEPASVCRALESMDLSRFTAAGVPVAAIFNLDSTVWDGNITDAFLAQLAERSLPTEQAHARLKEFLKKVPGVDAAAVDAASVADNARLLLERGTRSDIPAEQRVALKDVFYMIVALLEGLTVEQVQEAAQATFDVGAPPYPPWRERIFLDSDGCGMRQVVQTLKSRGVKVYLLSATPDFLTLPAAKLLGVPAEQALGSLLEVKEGRYTGKVRESTYYTKGAITRQWLPGPPLFAFGDSPTSDFAMLLEAAGPAFMVNARPSFLERDAKEAGSRLIDVPFDATEGTTAHPR